MAQLTSHYLITNVDMQHTLYFDLEHSIAQIRASELVKYLALFLEYFWQVPLCGCCSKIAQPLYLLPYASHVSVTWGKNVDGQQHFYVVQKGGRKTCNKSKSIIIISRTTDFTPFAEFTISPNQSVLLYKDYVYGWMTLNEIWSHFSIYYEFPE